MTKNNEQIIIDGVDVNGCINYRPSVDTTQVSYINACSIGVWQRWYSNLEPSCIMSCNCKYNPDCYYKQLKYLEKAFDHREKTYLTNLNNLADEVKFLREKLHSKEQECEELKDKLSCCFCNPHVELNDFEKQRKCTEVTECFRRKLDQLKKENEELKARLRPLEDSYFNGLSIIHIAELAKKSIRITSENRKLETALEEIREIAENAYCLTNATNKDMAQFAKQILQKINEVENVQDF